MVLFVASELQCSYFFFLLLSSPPLKIFMNIFTAVHEMRRSHLRPLRSYVFGSSFPSFSRFMAPMTDFPPFDELARDFETPFNSAYATFLYLFQSLSSELSRQPILPCDYRTSPISWFLSAPFLLFLPNYWRLIHRPFVR